MRLPSRLAAWAVGWMALAALLTVRLAGLAVDDFFITYRYAANLAAGQGFVFNPGERVFGLTEPGLGLLLAVLHRCLGAPIPWLGTALTGAALAGIALVLLADSSRARAPALPAGAAWLVPWGGEAMLAGTLAVGSSLLWVNQGGGTLPALFALLLAAVLAGTRPVTAGVLAGAAVWLRPDSLAGACLLALLLGWERRQAREAPPTPPAQPARRASPVPWRYLLASAAVVLTGEVLARSYFGSFLPNTLHAKHAMAAASPGSWSGLARFWPRILPLLPRHWGPAWVAVAVAGIAGQVPLFLASGRAGRLLVLFAAALALAYPLLGVPFFSWYAVPAVLAALYGLVFLGGAVGRVAAALVTRRGRWLGAAAGFALLLPLLASLVPASWRWCRDYRWQRHLETYREAALWLRRSSRPQEAVAYVEIGVLGFYSELPIDDLLGLVTPAALPYVEADDLPGAFLASPAPYVVFHTRGRMAPLVTCGWFPSAYLEVARFSEAGGGWLAIYHRRPGSPLPPPRPPRPAARDPGSTPGAGGEGAVAR